MGQEGSGMFTIPIGRMEITRGDRQYKVSTIALPMYDGETTVFETVVFEWTGMCWKSVDGPYKYYSEEEAISEHNRWCSEWQPAEWMSEGY